MLLLLSPIAAAAQEGSKAHEILLKTLALIQNPGGAQMDYRLRVAFYTKQGHIMFKGEKFRRESKKTIDWFDGNTFWSLTKSSNVCKIQRPKKHTDQNLASMMNAINSGCSYTMKDQGTLWHIRIKANTGSAKIKEAEVTVNKATYAPVQLRVKLGLLWANITLSNFQTANFNNDTFRFDPKKHPNAKIVDKR